MKNLSNFINETLSKDLKAQLLQLIDSESLTDDIGVMMLNLIQDNNRVSKDELDSYFINRGIEDDKKNIIRIFKDYGALNTLYNLMTPNSNNLITVEDFLKSDNIYNLIQKSNPVISIDLLKDLAQENPSRGGITRGMFEILCLLFLKEINNKNTSSGLKGHGDVHTNNLALEFKTPGARVKSQKEHSATLIDSYIEKEISKLTKEKLDFKKIMSSQKSIIEFIDSVNKVYSIIAEDWFDILVGGLFAQYDIRDKNMWSRLFDYKGFKSHFISIYSNKKQFAKDLIRLMGCIQLRFYQQEEMFDYIVIFKGRNGNQSLNTGDYICIDANYAIDINRVFNDNHIILSGGGDGYGSVRDHYCHIEYI